MGKARDTGGSGFIAKEMTMSDGRFVWAAAWVLTVAATALGAERFVSPTGDDAGPGTQEQPWRTVQRAANAASAGDTVWILDGTYNEQVTIRSAGSASAPITFSAYPGHSPVLDGRGTSWGSGVLSLQSVAHVRVSGLGIINAERSGQFAVHADASQGITIENCRIQNANASGLRVTGSQDVVLHANDLEAVCLGGGHEGISVSRHSSRVRVSYNRVHDSMKEGIDIKHGCSDVLVVRNEIFRVERQGLYVDAWDDPTHNIVFDGNVVYDSGFGAGACSEQGGLLSDVRFVNNLIYNVEGPGLFVADWGGGTTHPIDGVTFAHNTVHNAGTRWGNGMYLASPEAANIVVRNNIFSQTGSRGIKLSDVPISMTIENNLCTSATDLQPGWGFVGDPGFVNPQAGDFRLRADSDARDAAWAGEDTAVDLVRLDRPVGAGWDLGAYEWALDGDANGDGTVDDRDLSVLLSHWGDTYVGWISGDLTGDWAVDDRDLSRLLSHWGDTLAAPAIPEPACLALLALGALALRRR